MAEHEKDESGAVAERAWSDECPCGRVHGERTPSRMKPTCPACDRHHVTGDAVAVGRFSPDGVTGYRTPDGEVHPTRDAAQKWLCEQRQEARCG